MISKGKAEEALELLRASRRRIDDGTGGNLDSEEMTHELELLYALGRYREALSLGVSEEEGDAGERLRTLRSLAAFRLEQAESSASEQMRKRIRSFFFDGPLSGDSRWVYEELSKEQTFPDEPWVESAVLGRFSISERSYGDALRRLRNALALNRGAFLRYPELLADLGKAYQYGGAAAEGAERFAAWAEELRGMTPASEADTLRFVLLFYSGRMHRQAGNAAAAVISFDRALPLAPDPRQRDAAMWYLMDSALSRAPSEAVALIKKFAPIWDRPSYFADLLDRLCGILIAQRKWPELLEAFRVLRPVADGPTVARYAYVIGRAISEGYLNVGRPIELLDRMEIRNTPPPSSRADTARLFFRMAYEADRASYYYRSLSAAVLGETLDPAPAAASAATSATTPPVPDQEVRGAMLTFLLDFFRYGCGDLALPYAQRAATGLGPQEIRSLAAAFARAERWGESIRVAGFLSRIEGHRYTREDLQLLYPRPFAEPADRMAELHSIPKELFYGLLRTESAFMPRVVSRSGAVGLAQLMPATAADVAGRIARQGGPNYLKDGGPDLEDPETNLHLGAWYLEHLIGRTGSPMMALASYNGGQTRVRRWRSAQSELPEDLFLETIEITETREYGRKVLAAASVYGYLYFGMTMEAVVADIFPKTGGSARSVPTN